MSGPRPLWILLAVAALSALVGGAGLAGLDGQVARAVSGTVPGYWAIVIAVLDFLFLKPISNFLLGALLLLVAGVLFAIRRFRRGAWIALYVGLVQFLSTTIADLAKPPFGRLRPWEAAGQGGADVWFVGANSFPSGHAAFYGGLFLPFVALAPRLTPLWLVPPLFVAAARVMVSDHYLSDVAFSLALAALLAAALLPVERRAWPSPAAPAAAG
jgi:membrane-associated phospholipid phosphatase